VPRRDVALDLDVAVDRPMRIDGGGLDSWWRGRFAVRGTVAAPDVVGEMNVDRGAFTFIGQTFTLDSGKLVQTGGRRIDPEINAVGTRQNADIVATVTVTGRASAPRIELSSRPALPRDEVLARLLFQKRAAQLGAIESVQLANAAAELAGVSRGGLGGALQRTLGVDTLGLGGQSGSALVVGQRIGRNLYVGVEQDLRGTGRQIVLEWRLSRTLSLRSATNDETGADIGLSWRKDY
jgi:translocation and assembly module TamB